jgi:diadenosine tetraphosphatase ApaH/serine/threonine PP2A family protein phosphatase
MNIDKHIEELLVSEKCLDEGQMKILCERVKNILIDEPNVLRLKSPIILCGTLYGRIQCLRDILKVGGDPKSTTYLFMGNYVDKGSNSVETIQLLLLYKLKYPDSFFLLRGSHESRPLSSYYGFTNEIYRKYGNYIIWRFCMDVFDYLPISAVIDSQYFCVHAGLSPLIKSIDNINSIKRNVEIPHQGSLCDLLWSDPSEIEGWAPSPAGAGWLFGNLVVEDFNYINNIKMICRARQIMFEGNELMFDNKLVTLFSAPNPRYGGKGKIMKIKGNNEEYIVVTQTIKELPDYSNIYPYFL